jgi:hypothetical protein
LRPINWHAPVTTSVSEWTRRTETGSASYEGIHIGEVRAA